MITDWLGGYNIKPIQYRFFMLGNIETTNIQFTKKQSFFRNKIRRQQINAYFEMRRKEIKGKSSTIILSSQTQKEYFLQQARRKLIEGDQRERFVVLSELKESVGAFQGQFDQWAEGSLTGILLNAFQVEQQLKQKVQIAKIFIEIFQNCSQTRCKWVQLLRSRKIHQNLVKSLKSTPSNSQKRTYLQLLGCLCRTSSFLRDWIVVSTQQQLLNYGECLTQENGEELLGFLSVVVDYIAILVVPENIIRFAPIGFVIKLMPLLMKFLVGTKDIKIAVELLMTLRLAVKPRNQIVFSHFAQSQLNVLFYLLQYQQTKMSSLNLLNYISSSSSSRLAEELLNRGIVSVLQRQIESSGRERNVLKIALNILEHLATTEEEAFGLLEKSIWKEGIIALSHSQQSVREEAYYFVEAILNAIDNPQIQIAAIKKGGIIHIIMSQLCQASKSTQITLIAMRILQLYLRSQQPCGADPKNVLFLQSVYRFSQILDDIYMRSCRPQIQSKAEVLSSLFAEATMQPYAL